jgi:hypothetical protein
MKKPLITPSPRARTPEEQARYEARRQDAGWRCECDGKAGRARCSLPHVTSTAVPRCSRPAYVLVTETDGRDAVVCEDCAESRHTNALIQEYPQTELFDLSSLLTGKGPNPETTR